MDVLTPLRFHRVHGQSIKLSNDFCTAQIATPKENTFFLTHECLAFSSRPVAINEKVYLRLESLPRSLLDLVHFGFTDCDPNTIADLKSCEWVNWLKHFWRRLNDEDNIFHFCVKPSGEVSCFINDQDTSFLIRKININVPHWAVIILTHNVTTVKFIDSPKEKETEELKPTSIEKPLLPATNALDEPKKQFGNISNLKLNSTMDREEPESSKALQPETNIGNAKRPLEPEDCATSHADVAMDDLTPLRFHRVHGQFINISNDYCTAQIAPEEEEKSYSLTRECVAFSSRPIAINEKVYLRVEKGPSTYKDYSGLSIRDCDPNTLADHQYWPHLETTTYFESYNFDDKYFICHFCVKPSGEVSCFINDRDISCLFKKININVPHWAVIHLGRKVTTVKFIDSPKEKETEELKPPSIEKPLLPATNALDEPKRQFGNINNPKLNLTTDSENSVSSKAFNPLEEEDCATSDRFAMDDLTPLRFHRVHGESIKLSNDFCTAQIAIPKGEEEESYLLISECVAFSSRPIAINEKVYLRVETGPSIYTDYSGLSITDCDPNTLADHKYWPHFQRTIFFETFFDFNDKYNIYHFCVKPSGEVSCFINDTDISFEFSKININVPHWAVIQLGHKVTTVKFIDSPKEKETEELKPPSIEKPLLPATNALDEPKRQFGNINNPKLNLTTDSENSVSSKAFNPLEEEALRTSYTGGTPNNLPPLSFHSVHGKNVRVSRDGSMARRVESFCKGITFSARPVRVNEKVCLRFVEISNRWEGGIRFGFTNHDPAALAHSLPNSASPDLTEKLGNWAQPLNNRFMEQDNIVYYYVNSSGDIHFGVNGEDKGLFFSGIDTRSPLWALVDVYGNCIAVQFADPRALSQIKKHSPMEEERLVGSMRSLTIEESLPPLRYQNPLVPLSLHRTKGRNVQFINDRGVAARADAEFCQGYVFTARPMCLGQTIVIQILATESAYVRSLAFGLTSCDPATLRLCDLPDESELLLDRPEYWVVQRDAANALRTGDELAITLTLDGEVRVSRNGCTAVTVMHVDHTVRLWAFVDIYGATQKVRMLSTQVPQPAQTPPQQLRVLTGSAAPINAGAGGTVQLPNGHSEPPRLVERLPSGPSTSRHQPIYSVIGEENLTGTECTICYENPIDSVLYMCGHMCMCYRCAVQQWRGKGSGQCPLCREQIKDVIRPYKS